MLDDLRIVLHKSPRLQRLRHAATLGCVFAVVLSLYTADPGFFLAAVGLGLLATAFASLDPQGATLICPSIGEVTEDWRYKAPGTAHDESCALCASGKLSGVLWLDCHLRASRGGWLAPPRRLLVFKDAMSEEQWRLLRRQLRLQSFATSSR